VVDGVAGSSRPAVFSHAAGASAGVPVGHGSRSVGLGGAAGLGALTRPAAKHASGSASAHHVSPAAGGGSSVASAALPDRGHHGTAHAPNGGDRGLGHRPTGAGGNAHVPKGNAYGRAPHDSGPPPHPAPAAPSRPTSPPANGGSGSDHANAPDHAKGPGAKGPTGNSGH
jgi:hypothetical protein